MISQPRPDGRRANGQWRPLSFSSCEQRAPLFGDDGRCGRSQERGDGDEAEREDAAG